MSGTLHTQRDKTQAAAGSVAARALPGVPRGWHLSSAAPLQAGWQRPSSPSAACAQASATRGLPLLPLRRPCSRGSAAGPYRAAGSEPLWGWVRPGPQQRPAGPGPRLGAGREAEPNSGWPLLAAAAWLSSVSSLLGSALAQLRWSSALPRLRSVRSGLARLKLGSALARLGSGLASRGCQGKSPSQGGLQAASPCPASS